jgi:hypothetical protein
MQLLLSSYHFLCLFSWHPIPKSCPSRPSLTFMWNTR